MTPQEYARAWQKRSRDYGPAMKREFRAIGDLAHSVSDRLLTQEVYSKPEDRWPSGKYKGRRTKFLAVSEQPAELVETADTLQIVLVNTAPYSKPRHEANKPGRRQIDPQRTAHWRDDMLQVLGLEIPERIRRLSLTILRET
jgi:hypothetical protein